MRFAPAADIGYAVQNYLSILLLLLAIASSAFAGEQPDFRSRRLAVGLSRTAPSFSWFTVDSLGQGKLENNAVIDVVPGRSAVRLEFAQLGKGRFVYVLPGNGNQSPVWEIVCDEATITMRSRFVAGAPGVPFVLRFNQKLNHATLLGRMQPGDRRVALPCLLHLPDLGSVRIRCDKRSVALGYDARRNSQPRFVEIAFPPATASQPTVSYNLEIAAIYPKVPGIEKDARFDGFRRNYLNIFQLNPRLQMLANNASSDACAFTLFKYSEVALHCPPLIDDLRALDLVRMTLDRYLAGTKGYGLAGYGKDNPGSADIVRWGSPYDSADSYPSLVIAACNYIQGARDSKWARKNYDGIAGWARAVVAADKDGNGLIEYPTSGNYGDRPRPDRRPANWWDTINFGHEDAYANALAYRALTQITEVARNLGLKDDADRFSDQARKLREAYVPTFLNPATGVLAGWKSADRQLHDYCFTFVNGVAIAFGLVDEKEAQAILDKLIGKMAEVGYQDFRLGLPGNLVPVRRGDYLLDETPPEVFGVPRREDGSDGFQFYENGGATACFAYFTLKALYDKGRVDEARRILFPMLESFTHGDFAGFCANGMSKDWRDWRGECHGYEGFLVDAYLPLLAVLDEKASRSRSPLAPKIGSQR